jgi:hypothetical protein
MVKFIKSKSCKLLNDTGKVKFIIMGCVEVSESLDIGGEGIKLVLDGGDINGDGDVDVRHLGGDGADRVENNVVIGVGGGRELDRGMSEEDEECDRGDKGFRCKV